MEGESAEAMYPMEAPFAYDVLAPMLDLDEEPQASCTPVEEDAPVVENGIPEGDILEVPSWNDEDSDKEGIGDYIALLPESESNDDDELPPVAIDASSSQELPWLSRANFKSPVLQLHQEIVDFCKFISPTASESRSRQRAVERVSECIKALWPTCTVEVFGSFATGLYLPTSDVDMVVLNSGTPASQQSLRELAKMLRKHQLAKKQKLLIIAKARVPLVKFVEDESGISFDISFDVVNGPEAAKYIKRALASLPPLRPLCLVLKIFLQQRELNEVYTGGIGSYALLVMLLVHLQLHPSRQTYSNELEQNLGILLMDFLLLYGRGLNTRDVGISCSDGGRFFVKSSRGFYDKKRPYLLAVEDPQAPENDIGKNSFNIPKVRSAFMLAHRLLSATDGSLEHLGFLGRIIRCDKHMINRAEEANNENATEGARKKGAVSKDKGQAHKKKNYPNKKLKGQSEDNSPRNGQSEDKGPIKKWKAPTEENGFKRKWKPATEDNSPNRPNNKKRKAASSGRYTDHYDNGEVSKKKKAKYDRRD